MQIRMLVSRKRNAHTINAYSAQALVISVNLKLTLVSSNLTTISIAFYAFGVSAAAWVSRAAADAATASPAAAPTTTMTTTAAG